MAWNEQSPGLEAELELIRKVFERVCNPSHRRQLALLLETTASLFVELETNGEGPEQKGEIDNEIARGTICHFE